MSVWDRDDKQDAKAFWPWAGIVGLTVLVLASWMILRHQLRVIDQKVDKAIQKVVDEARHS